MNHSELNEYEKEFQSLDMIPRSDEVKRQTYMNIVAKRPMTTKWMGLIVAPVLAVAILLSFLFGSDIKMLEKESGSSEMQFQDVMDFKHEEITRVYVAPAVNLESFKDGMLNGVPIKGARDYGNNPAWNKELHFYFSRAVLLEDPIKEIPHFDLVLEVKGHAPLKLKLWLYKDGSGYISKYMSEEFYELKREDALMLYVVFEDFIR